MKISIKNIVKHYDKKVLDDISVDIDGYSAVAIIGLSGCGKSTLLRLISGLEYAESGEIVINGWKINKENAKAYRDQLGFVFQKHNLFPHLTLKKNITVILEKVKGQSKEQAEKRAEELLATLHLTDEMNKLPANVSGGQAQRASIARALSTKPELLILDEPTASLDPILTHEVLMEIKHLKSMGKDFIFVTHELPFVKKFADYVIFIDNGKIAEQGEVSILDSPKTDKLKAFLKNVTYD
ncbi:MAG: ATP-binding cassette domain-containing protein [Eubacteriales bacterium]